MKFAITIPDALAQEILACSRRLRVSRSRLFALAAREYLATHGPVTSATDAWNAAISAAGQPGEHPAALAVRRRSKAAIRVALADLQPQSTRRRKDRR